MRLAPLRCRSCGGERLVRERDRGTSVACDRCGAAVDVPGYLQFPEYRSLLGDRDLARRVTAMSWVGFLCACAPLAAGAWWLASGAIQRSLDEGRPVDPVLARARIGAVVVTVLQCAMLAFALVMSLR